MRGQPNLILDVALVAAVILAGAFLLFAGTLWDEFRRGWKDGGDYDRTQGSRSAREDWGHGYGDSEGNGEVDGD